MRVIVRVGFNILIAMMKEPGKRAGNITMPVYKSKVYPHLWYSLPTSKRDSE